MVSPRLINRRADLAGVAALVAAGIHPLLARLWVSRGVTHLDQTRLTWAMLIPPASLTRTGQAATILANAIHAGQRILVIADYDCDGATACAVALRALRSMGAQVNFLVPSRFKTGYGLSPAVVELALKHAAGKPDLLLTVDNGIASVEGVAAANAAGLGVVITDHHLPGATLPDALVIVNPNQPGCSFPSKHLAGVGVIFYMMLALRAELRRRGVYTADGGPHLDTLSDLVALGTVADVVQLDTNNRLLVTKGLARIRSGHMHAGIRALFTVACREPCNASSLDLGFSIGPRINAAGRLADMSCGIELLSTDDTDVALNLARQLDHMNHERRGIEIIMRAEAMASIDTSDILPATTVCIYNANWHQGVVGLVAARLKEKFWRPTLAFAPAGEGELRGSGRSIPEVHLRDILDFISKRHQGLIKKFGGHAMAAGLTLDRNDLPRFAEAFEQSVRELSGCDRFEPQLETDGSLEILYANVEVAELLQSYVWGSGFAVPLFLDTFMVRQQRLLGGKHLKLLLERDSQRFDAIWFSRDTLLPEWIDVAYRLEKNIYNGNVSVQLVIEHAAQSKISGKPSLH